MMSDVYHPRMSLRYLVLLLLGALFSTVLSGCGAAGGSPSDTVVDNTAVYEQLDKWEQAVEGYDVPGMTDPLTGSFTLTLTEGGLSIDKTRDQLYAELEMDLADQTYWRQQYGYQLDLTFSGMSATSSPTTATVVTSFTVTEWASGVVPEIPRTTTDTGRISCQLVKVDGVWKIAGMTISFDPLGAASLSNTGAPGSPVFQRSS